MHRWRDASPLEIELARVLAVGPGPLQIRLPRVPVLVEISTDGDAEATPSDPADDQAGGPTPDPSVTELRAVGRSRSEADASLLESIGRVMGAVRERLLAEKGLLGVELSPGRERTLVSDVKRAAVADVQVALGFGITEAQSLVGVAGAAGDLLAVVLGALRRGEATWPLVRTFWTSSASLQDEQRLLVAMALFGDDPGLACEERLGPDGELVSWPWGAGTFQAACQREVTACEGEDVAGERERRRRAYARRRASVRVHDDGTATLSATGPAVTMAAAHQRIDRAARLIRAAGDERSLDNLRCDLINALLLYGTFPFPGVGDADDATSGDGGEARGDDDQDNGHGLGGVDDVLSPEDLATLVRVINALPLTQMQVVVPHGVFGAGVPLCPGCAGALDGSSSPDGGQDPGPPDPGPPDPDLFFDPDPDPAPDPTFGPSPDVPPAFRRPGRGQVAEVLGPHPFFITPGHVRELVMLPGTTLHRLVADHLDGRLVERSIGSYRPDADMRRQVRAADMYSRAPGSRTGSHACELDHVVPYGWAGGETSETNLAMLGKGPHKLKTLKVWSIAIGPRRDLTVTTLLGQVATTRTHDFRQYTHTRDVEDLEDLRDLANRATYAAMAARPEHRYRLRGDAWLTMTHTDKAGAVRPGPPPQPETLDEVLGTVDGDATTD